MRYALNSAPINGNARLYGNSTALLVEIGATGYSNKQKHAQSTAALVEVQAAGTILQAKTGRGTAPIVVDAIGQIKRAMIGLSQAASVAIEARHGIPNPMPTRMWIVGQNSTRMVVVPAEDRGVELPAEQRSIIVQPDRRDTEIARGLESV